MSVSGSDINGVIHSAIRKSKSLLRCTFLTSILERFRSRIYLFKCPAGPILLFYMSNNP